MTSSDARQHHPAAGRSSSATTPTLPRPRPPSHLRLVSPPTPGAPAADPAPSDAGTALQVWSHDQLRNEIELFSRSEWGACLPDEARLALAGVLLSPTVPSGFNGYSGVVFLNRMLDSVTLARRDDLPADALRALPTALRAWVRFNRRTAGSADAVLTLALLEHIDQLEPGWQLAVDERVISSEAPAG